MTESSKNNNQEYISLKREIISILSSMKNDLLTKLGEVLLSNEIRKFYYKKINKPLDKIYLNFNKELANDNFFNVSKYFTSVIFPRSLIDEINKNISLLSNSNNHEEYVKNIYKIVKKLLDILLNSPYSKSIKKIANNNYKKDIFNNKVNDLSHLLPILSSNNIENEIWILSDKEKENFNKIELSEERRDYFLKILNKKIYKVLSEIKKYKNGSIFNQSFITDDKFIHIKNLNKIYSTKELNVHVIKDLSLDIKKGEFVLLVGPSGSGKTTLMNMIAGIDDISFGDIIVDGINISLLNQKDLTIFRKNNVGYIFQRYALIPNLTVAENIRIGAYISNRVNPKNFKKYVMPDEELDELLKQLDLFEIKNKYPYQLSGGQQQRVAIARTIAKKPLIIFADEPTSALDEASTKIVTDMLKIINEKLGITIIMITHNEKDTSYATRIIRMKNGNLD